MKETVTQADGGIEKHTGKQTEREDRWVGRR